MKRGLIAMLIGLFSVSLSWAEGKKSGEHKETAAQSAPKKKGFADELSGQGYGMAGCGLGSIVFGEKEGLVQVIAATVNGTFYSQTFGMTSGTSNCDSYKDMASIQFIDANRYTLENDVVRGGGETLTSLTQLMGCENDAESLKAKYGEIFSGVKDPRKIYFSIRHNVKCEG